MTLTNTTPIIPIRHYPQIDTTTTPTVTQFVHWRTNFIHPIPFHFFHSFEVVHDMNSLLLFILLSLALADKYAIIFQGDTGYTNYSDSSNTCRAYEVNIEGTFHP